MMYVRMDHHTKDVSIKFKTVSIIKCRFYILFVEALAYQMIGLYKGDQYYFLGIKLADKFAGGSLGDVSCLIHFNLHLVLLFTSINSPLSM